jgi:hypothetical protein
MFKVGISGLTQDVKYMRLLPTKTTHTMITSTRLSVLYQRE